MIKTFEQFNNDVYYHGSDSEFEHFENKNNRMYAEEDVPTWFFTKDKHYAASYGKYLYTVVLHNKKLFDLSDNRQREFFVSELEKLGYDAGKIDKIFDEQFSGDLPYWTCGDAFYVANANGYDSIKIAEELDKDIESIGIFDPRLIEIIDVR